MVSKIEPKEGEIWGKEKVRKYAEGHKKYAGLMYRGMMKNVRVLNLSGRFLEVGAGPGFLAMMMAREQPGVSIIAIDVSLDMVEVAREYILENKLGDRISYIVGDVGDKKLMQSLGKFDFVYATYSLHHWKEPEDSIRNLWNAVGDNGVLYIYDFRRLGLLCALPVKDGIIESIKAAYTPGEIRAIFQKIGVTDYRIKNAFPFLMQSVIARK